MIFVTGDIHGELSIHKLNTEAFPMQKELTKDDYVIICGDFGLVWDYAGESNHEKFWLNWLEDKPFTTLFVDGNHECHTRLNSYPVEDWNGGKVHKIRPSVIHLMRSQVFNIDGKRCFTFGGAKSHDIKDGILDPDNPKDCEKMYAWRKDYSKMFRILGISWWPEEMPSIEEMDEGLNNLKTNDYNVDFVFTHCCPTSTQYFVNPSFSNDELTDYLENIRQKLYYKKWYFGHYHQDKAINMQDIAIFDDIVQIN